MNALLVRVGADQSEGGGYFNGPVDSRMRKFAYVPIPETAVIQAGMTTPYSLVAPSLHPFGVSLADQLVARPMHLDPDFRHLTYGDQGQRASQIQTKLTNGDLIVFYAGLRDCAFIATTRVCAHRALRHRIHFAGILRALFALA